MAGCLEANLLKKLGKPQFPSGGKKVPYVFCWVQSPEVDELCFLKVDCLHQFKRHGELATSRFLPVGSLF